MTNPTLHMRLLAMVTTLLILCGCVRSEAPAPAPSSSAVVAETPVPPTPPPSPPTPAPAETAAAEACPSHDGDRTRWLDSGHHVPLAVSRPGGKYGGDVVAATQACCAAWRGVGRVWTTVDAHGQPVGKAKVAEDWLYDVTECYVNEFEQVEGDPGVGLYATSDAGYRAPKSLKWVPDADQRAGFEAIAKQTDTLVGLDDRNLWPDPKPLGPLADRVVFFRGGHDAEAARYAVYGGRYLAIVALGEDGRWRLQYLDQTEARWPTTGNHNYRVRAALDLDHDGDPEIVVHRKEAGGETFRDLVIGTTHGFPNWEVLIESIGGAVI